MSAEQDWKDQGLNDLAFLPSASVPTAPHPTIQRIHDSPGLTQMFIDLWLTTRGDMNITAKVSELMPKNINRFSTLWNCLPVFNVAPPSFNVGAYHHFFIYSGIVAHGRAKQQLCLKRGNST